MPPEQGPEVQGVPVTAGHWQDPPVNRWAFWHVPEILPTYRVARGRGPARRLPESRATADLRATSVTRADGSAGTVGDVLADTFTDAYVVLQDGELVTEWYGPQGAADRTHALMSVSKSVVGCVAAILIDRGQLDADARDHRLYPRTGRQRVRGRHRAPCPGHAQRGEVHRGVRRPAG